MPMIEPRRCPLPGMPRQFAKQLPGTIVHTHSASKRSIGRSEILL
jgi:hypothetical protein